MPLPHPAHKTKYFGHNFQTYKKMVVLTQTHSCDEMGQDKTDSLLVLSQKKYMFLV